MTNQAAKRLIALSIVSAWAVAALARSFCSINFLMSGKARISTLRDLTSSEIVVNYTFIGTEKLDPYHMLTPCRASFLFGFQQ